MVFPQLAVKITKVYSSGDSKEGGFFHHEAKVVSISEKELFSYELSAPFLYKIDDDGNYVKDSEGDYVYSRNATMGVKVGVNVDYIGDNNEIASVLTKQHVLGEAIFIQNYEADCVGGYDAYEVLLLIERFCLKHMPRHRLDFSLLPSPLRVQSEPLEELKTTEKVKLSFLILLILL